MIAYFNGNFLNQEDIRISPEDRGFLFADGLYEVTRVGLPAGPMPSRTRRLG